MERTESRRGVLVSFDGTPQVRDCIRRLTAVKQDRSQAVLGQSLRLIESPAACVRENAPVHALALGQVAAILQGVGMAETGQEHRELVADVCRALPGRRVPTLRFIEAVHLAVHPPDAQRRRDPVRVAHLPLGDPQQRFQNIQGLDVMAVVFQVVRVRQQRRRDEPRVLVGVDILDVAHQALEVRDFGAERAQLRAVALRRGRLITEDLGARRGFAIRCEQVHEPQHEKRPLPQPDGGGGRRFVGGPLQKHGVGERQRARRDFRHP